MAVKMRELWKSDAVKAWGSGTAKADMPGAAPAVAPDADLAESQGDSGGGSAAPASTSTDLFFNWDSAELTASAKKALDGYAKAHLAAKSADKIVVDAYASTDGKEQHNKTLSEKRAKAVEDYLIQQGVPKDKIAAKGHGETDSFSTSDLAQNRRATLKPPPPTAPPSSGKLSMRDPKPLTGGGKDDQKINIDPRQIKLPPGTPPAPPKPKEVSRAEVQKELEKWLTDLAKSQNNNKDQDVKSTDIVWQADSALHFNLPSAMNQYTKKEGGDGQLYRPADLARKIAEPLPDTIPEKNFEKFKKLKPVNYQAPPKTITGQLRKKYHEQRDKIIDKLPKWVPDWAKEKAKAAMDAAVEKGVDFVLDKALTEAGIDGNAEKEMNKAVEEYVKKVTGDESGANK
ncbi:MAG: OmpA family protein [Gemmataceae bacterium]|nr:OmpA family protein [Gemmataceae bacterium]